MKLFSKSNGSKKAIANLVDNALKFISEGGRAQVALFHHEGETEHCPRLQYMSISDTLSSLASGHRGRGRVLLDEILSL